MDPDRPSDAPAAELHVVAAPTEAFFTRLALLAASIRCNGGGFASAPIIVTLSRDVEPYDVASTQPWSRALDVRWRWVDADVWRDHDMYGSAMSRMQGPFDAPFVVLLDADMVCTGPLDELVQLAGDGLAGVVAHVSPAGFTLPWRDGELRHGERFWAELYAGLELPPPALVSQHTGWGVNDADPNRRWCPPYYNLGLLAARASTMQRLGEVVFDEMERIDALVETGFRCQLATMTALARTGTPSTDLPPSWNFANDPHHWLRFASSARDVRLLHYLRPNEFDRERDSSSMTAVDAFVARHMTQPQNELLRRTFAQARQLLRSLEQPVAAHG